MVLHLARVVGVGIETADMLVNEVLSRPKICPSASATERDFEFYAALLIAGRDGAPQVATVFRSTGLRGFGAVR